MKQTEFKNKLDNREFWGDNSKEMWDAAYKWQDQANVRWLCVRAAIKNRTPTFNQKFI